MGSKPERRNILLEFFEQQRKEFGRTYEWWADRWGIPNAATVARWAKGDRRIGPNNRHVFKDLPFTMDEYYNSMPASDQTQSRSDVKRYGRTRAKISRKTRVRPSGRATPAEVVGKLPGSGVS